MDALATLNRDSSSPDQPDDLDAELAAIEELRAKAIASRDFLYCSLPARHLVEQEIPRLLEIIRRLRRQAPP